MTWPKRLPSPFPHRPKKRFGQHFLAPEWADKLVKAIAPRLEQTFLEIGPGQAALTQPLAAQARRVVAVEIDRELAATLRTAAVPNLTVLEADFLTIEESVLQGALGHDGTRVAANLPYNVASPILFRLVDLAPRLHLTDATLMLQREVADRLVAAPGSRDYGVLTVLITHRASVERLLTLPPGAFRPPPKVRSAVVRVKFHPPEPSPVDLTAFEHIVQAAFTRRRKTLANALLTLVPDPTVIARAARAASLDASRRPETFSVPEWVALSDALAPLLPHQGSAVV